MFDICHFEAILRRLDHDANKMLSFEEFCEAVGEEPSNDEDEAESKDAHQFERNNESPLRKAQEESEQEERKAQNNQDKNKKQDKLQQTPQSNTKTA